MMSDIKKLLDFFHLSEGLKNELRNGYTSRDKKESVADHTWRVSLMVILLSRFLDQEISLEKALKMAIIHDLAEIITGDEPYFLCEGIEQLQNKKFQKELLAMQHIKNLLPESIGIELVQLWREYEEGETIEAKFVKAVDKIEAQIQHNEMCYSHWNDHDRKFASNRLDKYCVFDSFLVKLKTLVQEESMQKMNSTQVT